jgi:hypothetical protein
MSMAERSMSRSRSHSCRCWCLSFSQVLPEMVPGPTRYQDGTVAVSVCSAKHSLIVQLMKVPPFEYQMHLASLAWISWQRRHDQNEKARGGSHARAGQQLPAPRVHRHVAASPDASPLRTKH